MDIRTYVKTVGTTSISISIWGSCVFMVINDVEEYRYCYYNPANFSIKESLLTFLRQSDYKSMAIDIIAIVIQMIYDNKIGNIEYREGGTYALIYGARRIRLV